MHTFSVQILCPDHISKASRLVEREWGTKYVGHFIREMENLAGRPDTTLIGCFTQDGTLCGITVINKSEMDFEYWSITWVVVDPLFRNHGLGRKLIKAAEEYIIQHKNDYPISRSRAIVQLTTTIPQFYEKLGYTSVYDELMVKVC